MMSTAKYYAASLTIKTSDKTKVPQVIKFSPRKIKQPNR